MKAPDADELVSQAVSLAGTDDLQAKQLLLEAAVMFDARRERDLASRALFAAAGCAFRLGEFEEAERLSLDVASRTVGAVAQAQAYLLAGEAARHRGAAVSADAAFTAAMKSSLAWRAHLGRLRLALERGDEIHAESCLDAARKAALAVGSPTSADAPADRDAAECAVAFEYGAFLSTRRPTEAIEHFQRALELCRRVPLSRYPEEPASLGARPTSLELREQVALVKVRVGRTEAAKRELFSLLTELRELGHFAAVERVQDALRRLDA